MSDPRVYSVHPTRRSPRSYPGRRIAIIKPYAGDIGAAAFSRSGRTLAIGGENGTVQFWDVRTGRRLATFAGPGLPLRLVYFSPDGHLIAVGSSHVRMTL